jgi:hypothetical protein
VSQIPPLPVLGERVGVRGHFFLCDEVWTSGKKTSPNPLAKYRERRKYPAATTKRFVRAIEIFF